MLGKTVKDKITGLTGVVTGYVRYITGCNQALVQPRVKKGDFQQSHWIDEQRLEVLNKPAITLEPASAPVGFDKPAPRR